MRIASGVVPRMHATSSASSTSWRHCITPAAIRDITGSSGRHQRALRAGGRTKKREPAIERPPASPNGSTERFNHRFRVLGQRPRKKDIRNSDRDNTAQPDPATLAEANELDALKLLTCTHSDWSCQHHFTLLAMVFFPTLPTLFFTSWSRNAVLASLSPPLSPSLSPLLSLPLSVPLRARFSLSRGPLEPNRAQIARHRRSVPFACSCALRSALNDNAHWTPDCGLGGEISRAAAWLSIVE
jgi:hypothetical protein